MKGAIALAAGRAELHPVSSGATGTAVVSVPEGGTVNASPIVLATVLFAVLMTESCEQICPLLT